MNCSRSTIAKTIVLFFAVLFVAVLIHPDLDLLDVHDVKISSVRSLPHSVEGQLVPQFVAGFARPQLEQPRSYDYLHSTALAVPSFDLSLSSTLRV